jgi:hypothetical protein
MNNTIDSTPDNHSIRFADSLERAMRASGMTQTMFGYLHFGDPGFMKRIREGHRLQRKTIAKIESVLVKELKGK